MAGREVRGSERERQSRGGGALPDERVMAGVSGVTEPDGTATEIPHKLLFDGYADALREAIRCVKQVNGLV